MGSPVITVENLGKRYTLRHQARNALLRDRLSDLLRNPFRHLRAARQTSEEFWALRDVSFSVNQGDVVGIIGRNGAGKSTLLKILSRITEPTTGRITLRGRVASLLEVGTGFHGELSGRENIFLNGAILGMSRAEIRKKFDEIVAFAEVEKFLDTPVKRYSSGMYVRLAFAVAAHLEPEILIVDEVLAVGDADFQQKCLAKMDNVTSQEGRTILFVSHQLQAIQQLCKRAIVLNKGCLIHDSTTASAISAYTALNKHADASRESVILGKDLRLASFEFTPEPVEVFNDLQFHLHLTAEQELTIYDVSMLIYSGNGQRAGITDLREGTPPYKLEAGGHLRLTGALKRIALIPGRYSVGLFIKTSRHMGDHFDLSFFEVQPTPDSIGSRYKPEYLGMVAFDMSFNASVSQK